MTAKTNTIPCRHITLTRGRSPFVMGILNVTPDSFSDGGFHDSIEGAYRHAVAMADDGATIIDIGGESTRPGADAVSVEEEIARVRPVIQRLAEHENLVLSIDTRNSATAAMAMEAGCHMINDVTACSDPEMADVAVHYDATVVLMHMLGDPKNMQADPQYKDVVRDVGTFLVERAERLVDKGVNARRIIVDPGIGFGKTLRHNLELLKHLPALKSHGYPVLVGASRKRFIGTLLNDAPTDERLSGSLAAAAHCFQTSVDIVRVHDVKPTVDLYTVLESVAEPPAPRTRGD